MIRYQVEPDLSIEEFRDVLLRSTLAERRPVNEPERLAAMLKHGNLMLTARSEDGLLVGVSRSVTDFVYCCYLSDLAVDQAFQRQGIGRELIRLTHKQLHPQTRLLLLAAPAAKNYYHHIGMTYVENGWVLPPGALLP